MARNSITDVTDLLIGQLERLYDDEISTEELEKEVTRAKAMVNITETIIDAGRLQVEFIKATDSTNPQTTLFKNVVKLEE